MSGNVEVAQKVVPPAVAARLASVKARKEAGLVGRTAVVPVWLNRRDHVRAHEGCHAAAGLWNKTVAWLRGQWEQGETANKEDVRRFVTSLPSEARPFHPVPRAHRAGHRVRPVGCGGNVAREEGTGLEGAGALAGEEVPTAVVFREVRLATHP